MATGQGRKPRPHGLRVVEGKGDGVDSGGRKINPPPAFIRIPPERPDYLSPIAADLWDRIVEQLPKLGLLKELDGPSLEVLCETYARWRDAVGKRHKFGYLVKREGYGHTIAPWLRVEAQASKEFRSWCSEYGLTPSAEMRLAGPTQGTGDPNVDNPFAAGS